MNDYRRGAVLGLTIAETFILLTFLLLIILLGLAQLHENESLSESNTESVPMVWVRPERIETLMSTAERARKAQRKAEKDRAVAEFERDQAKRDLELLRRKGENPPCWYQVIDVGEGKTREKPYYAFNVAIYEDSIELAQRNAPPGGAFDDDGGLYADEWERLRIKELPYGQRLSDHEFTDAVSNLVTQGKSSQVRTYECVFSVMVWDKTPAYAKKRWKDAHDRIIEGLFSAYTVRDLEWKGVE